MAGYKGGHILRIKVNNFMTYDELEIFPKHGLNLVVGLNGSGKSSVMCAICLGLAGKPQFTGRSAQLIEFIKYGCDKATIEIELEHLSKRNVVITRIIQRQGDKTTWILNKNTVSLNEIQNTVKKFNIDIGNLCQFLPQEKVAEFSKMDKKQRLDNMLQAIGEPRLYTLFKELKELKQECVKVEEMKSRHVNLKEIEYQKNIRLKVDVDKHEEKLRLKEHLKSLSQYKLVLQYKEIKKKVEEIKEERQPIKAALTEVSKKYAEADEEIREKKRELHESVEAMRTRKNTLASIKNSISKSEADMSELHGLVESAKIHYQNKIEERSSQLSKMCELEKQLKALQDLHNRRQTELPLLKEQGKAINDDACKIKNELSALTDDLTRTKMEKNRLDYNINDLKMEIERMQEEENIKMKILKQRHQDAYAAVLWLRDNKTKFKKRIFPPMLLSLKVYEENDRKFVENTVSMRDFVAFLCEDKEDNKLLTTILRVQKKLNVNIVMVPEGPLSAYNSLTIDRSLRNLGIRCFMRDLMEAPEGIMKFLCHCYGLHKIPICLPHAEQNMESILGEFRIFFTPEAKFTGKRSRYGEQNVSIRRDAIRPKNVLPSSKDHSNQLQLLKQNYEAAIDERNKLVAKRDKLSEEMHEKEKTEHGYRVQRKALQDKEDEINNIQLQLKQKSDTLDKKKHDLVDEDREKFTLKTKVQGLNSQKIKACKELFQILEKFIEEKKAKLKINLIVKHLYQHLEECKKRHAEIIKEKKELEAKLEVLNADRTRLFHEGRNLHEQIRTFIPENNEQQLKKMFEDFENQSLEDNEAEIRSVQAKLDLNCEDSEEVMVEYREREKRINETQKEIEVQDKNLRQIQLEMTKKKSEWLPALQKHIKNINYKFSQYYKQLKCAGEISLDTCNDSDDFPKYGLKITLKYRDNEPFMELSNTHHSGGECSVAAIIFILSLQELTEVPFRCIDEINQGMDSVNERNIYSLIADSAKNGSCSQYFLLTPKLLMDLEMIENRDVAVHIIYNSSFLEMTMDVNRHIELAGRN